AAQVDGAHLHVLIIDGGSTPAQNYQSHLLHVQQMAELVRRAGVQADHLTIFASDGANPGPDLAVRDVEPERDFWLLDGTRLDRTLRPVTYVDSVVPGVILEAARRDRLRRWFKIASRRLGPDDTLLLYVTDHGTRNEQNTANNRITLWGKDEWLSVRELAELIGKLDPRVRVVTLMSQCYSGAFANLIDVHPADGVPSGGVCGFYSSTPERPAYGCYPENRGVANV